MIADKHRLQRLGLLVDEQRTFDPRTNRLSGTSRLTVRRQLAHALDVAGLWRLAWLAPLWIVVQRYHAFAGPIDPCDLTSDMHGGLEFSELSRRTLGAVLEANPVLDHSTLTRRLEGGERCGLWWADGRVVHYRWLTMGPAELHFMPLIIHPGDDEFVIQEVFTRPDYRRRGLMQRSRIWSVRTAATAGRNHRLSFVAWWNLPSLAVARRHDRCVGSLTRWRLPHRSIFRAGGNVLLEGRCVVLRHRAANLESA